MDEESDEPGRGCATAFAATLVVSAIILWVAGLVLVAAFVGIAAGLLLAGLLDSWIDPRR